MTQDQVDILLEVNRRAYERCIEQGKIEKAEMAMKAIRELERKKAENAE